LLEKQYIEPKALQEALEKAHAEKKRLGEVLLENGYVNEEMLARSLAASTHKLFVKDIHVYDPKLPKEFDTSTMVTGLFYPLMKLDNSCVVAETVFSDPELYRCELDDTHKIHTVYTSTKQIQNACAGNLQVNLSDQQFSMLVRSLLNEGVITWEQAVIALENRDFVFDVLEYMGVELTVA